MEIVLEITLLASVVANFYISGILGAVAWTYYAILIVGFANVLRHKKDFTYGIVVLFASPLAGILYIIWSLCKPKAKSADSEEKFND